MVFKAKFGGGPKQVGALLPKVTGKVLAKKGFPNMSLIADWPAIVGPELASYTCPEKLSWPRKPQDTPIDEADAPAGGKRRGIKPAQGISLKLRVESHRALDVQYGLDEIIGRINTYFGYRAVTDIRIVQGPVPGHGDDAFKGPDHSEHVMAETDKPLADLSLIEDEELREALSRLEQARRG